MLLWSWGRKTKTVTSLHKHLVFHQQQQPQATRSTCELYILQGIRKKKFQFTVIELVSHHRMYSSITGKFSLWNSNALMFDGLFFATDKKSACLVCYSFLLFTENINGKKIEANKKRGLCTGSRLFYFRKPWISGFLFFSAFCWWRRRHTYQNEVCQCLHRNSEINTTARICEWSVSESWVRSCD